MSNNSRDAEDIVIAWLDEVVGVSVSEHVDRADVKVLLDSLGAVKKEFKMVESRSAEWLEEGVNELLDQGWHLHGVTMMATEPGGLGTASVTCRFVQALVREAGGDG